jgi:hypothetical protein
MTPRYDPSAVSRRRPKQAVLEMGDTKPKASWSFHIVGGWTGYSAYIPHSSLPLCDHDFSAMKHESVDMETLKQLKPRPHFLVFCKRYCLTAEWQGHAAGSEVIVNGTVGVASRIDVYVKEAT